MLNLSKTKRVLMVVSLLFVVLTTAIGTGLAQSEEKTVGFLIYTRSNIFCINLEQGMEKYIKDNDLNWRLMTLDADCSPGRQTNQMDDLIQRQADLIILEATDPNSLIPAVEEANRAGIPVITIDGPVNGGEIVTFVGTDNFGGGFQAGKFAAEYINEELGGEGNVVILDNVQSQVVAGARVRGFQEGLLDDAPGATVIAHQDTANLRDRALNVFDNIMQGNKVIDVVFATNDDAILGALAAAESARRDEMIFIGFNGDEESALKIQEGGQLKATIAQYPFRMGEMTIEIAYKYLTGEQTEFPAEFPVGTELITIDNVDHYLETTEFD